ncbi:MAG: hypothetical protein JST68_22910 [Bacteroidetes bacterium]|nr:hypothetical protein [Bacteroidota bacterium]
MLFAFLIWIVIIIGGWKMFEKAGQPGWAFIIPIYNTYILLKIVGKPTWWLILMFFLPFIFGIWACNMLSKSFGKEEGFTVGLVLLPFIFIPILGFGDAKYLGPFGDPAAFKAATTPQFDFDKPATA